MLKWKQKMYIFITQKKILCIYAVSAKFQFKRGVACLITWISPLCIIVSYQKSNEKMCKWQRPLPEWMKSRDTESFSQVSLTFFHNFLIYKMKFFLKSMIFFLKLVAKDDINIWRESVSRNCLNGGNAKTITKNYPRITTFLLSIVPCQSCDSILR